MAMKKMGYSTPRSSAGMLGIGSGTFGGLKIDPMMILIVTVVFVVIVNLINFFVSNGYI